MSDTKLTPQDELAVKVARAKRIAKTAQAAERDFTDSEKAEITQLTADVERIQNNIENAKADQAMLGQLKHMVDPNDPNVAGEWTDTGATKADGGGGIAGDPVRPIYADEKAAAEIMAKLRPSGTKALVPSGGVSVPTRLEPGVIQLPGVRLRWLSELMRSVTVPGPETTFLRQTVRSNLAAPVALGAEKPTSVYSIEQVTTPVTTIAHLSEAMPRQYFDDDSSLQAFVQNELLGGLGLAAESQFVSGTGVAPALTGILNTTGVQAQAFDTSPLVTLRSALTLLELASVEASAFVLNPADWQDLELLAGTDGQYIFSGVPGDPGRRQLFGVDVVATPAIAAGTAIVARWQDASGLYRGGTEITWTETHDADWSKNLIRFRAEFRVGLAVVRPASFVIADLTAA